MKNLLLTLVFVATTIAAHTQSFKGSAIGKGIRFMPKDSSFSIQWNTRFQTLYAGVYDTESGDYEDALMTRRFRLKFKGFLVDPRISYKIELALSNQDQSNFLLEEREAASLVLDAVMKYKFHPNWTFWVGQTKLPGNRERVISSGSLQFVGRSRLNSRFTIDRDQGVQLHHEHKAGHVVFRQIGSIAMGEGRNTSINSDSEDYANGITGESKGYEYTVRGEILPFGKFTSKGDYFGSDLKKEESPKLSIGITYDYNMGNNRTRGNKGDFIDNRSDLATVFADLMFKYQGFSVMYEYANKKVAKGNESGFTASGDEEFYYTGQGHNFQTGFVFDNMIGLDLRFTDISPSSTDIDDAEKRFELGFSKFIGGHNLKYQTSVVYRDRATKGDELLVSAQLEIGF